MRVIRLCTLIVLLSSFGCSHHQPGNTPLARPVDALPIAADSVATVEARSELTASFMKGSERRTTRMLLVLEADKSGLKILGVTPAGIPLFTFAQVPGGEMQTTVAGAVDVIEPDRILADLQLCLWPLEILESGLPPEFSVRQTEATRQLEHAGVTLVDVTYTGAVTGDFTRNASLGVTLHHRLLDYTIEVRPLLPVKRRLLRTEPISLSIRWCGKSARC